MRLIVANAIKSEYKANDMYKTRNVAENGKTSFWSAVGTTETVRSAACVIIARMCIRMSTPAITRMYYLTQRNYWMPEENKNEQEKRNKKKRERHHGMHFTIVGQ